ncbi:MAG: hypothetical protein BIFFINMI_02589 [Phycisphaerae bacterium]|nr:hypothetical protein [Phycisphaerae bacterium]
MGPRKACARRIVSAALLTLLLAVTGSRLLGDGRTPPADNVNVFVNGRPFGESTGSRLFNAAFEIKK